MSLIVEDGTGLPDSNSYVSISDADAMLADREVEAWFPLSDYKKAACLIEATDYVDAYNYGGVREFEDQALSFPRSYAYGREGQSLVGVPPQLKKAVILLAAQAVSGPLRPSTTATSGALKRMKVGPLEKEFFEGTTASAAAGRSFPEVTALLRDLVQGGFGGISGSVMRWS